MNRRIAKVALLISMIFVLCACKISGDEDEFDYDNEFFVKVNNEQYNEIKVLCIVRVVSKSKTFYDGNYPYTEFDVEIINSLKGEVEDTFTIWMYGGYNQEGEFISVKEDVVKFSDNDYLPKAGEYYLLAFNENLDIDNHVVNHWFLYEFNSEESLFNQNNYIERILTHLESFDTELRQ